MCVKTCNNPYPGDGVLCVHVRWNEVLVRTVASCSHSERVRTAGDSLFQDAGCSTFTKQQRDLILVCELLVSFLLLFHIRQQAAFVASDQMTGCNNTRSFTIHSSRFDAPVNPTARTYQKSFRALDPSPASCPSGCRSNPRSWFLPT